MRVLVFGRISVRYIVGTQVCKCWSMSIRVRVILRLRDSVGVQAPGNWGLDRVRVRVRVMINDRVRESGDLQDLLGCLYEGYGQGHRYCWGASN